METKPTVVCLCGSMRFWSYFLDVAKDETLAGRVVLMPFVNLSGRERMLENDKERTEFELIKGRLDELHRQKIDLADEILVVNYDHYIGESTRSEINYARLRGKKVRFVMPISSPIPASREEDDDVEPQYRGDNCR